MAKDPAFLFYPGDWQGGTATMSRFLKGCYMDLLIAQFNSGPLSLEEIRTVLGNDFAAWGTLSKKFKEQSGKFFNERLEQEKNKRKEFTASRRNNISGKNQWTKKENGHMTTHKTKHMTSHMENGNENENRIENEVKGGAGGSWTPPSQAMCEDFFVKCDKPRELGEKFYLHYKAVNWHMNGNPIRDWTALAQKWILNEKTFKNGSNTTHRRDNRREPAPHNSSFGDL